MTRFSTRIQIAIVATALLLWHPGVAEACSVCFASGRGEQSRMAFRDTTIFLSFLPLIAVAGMVWWLRRSFRQHAGAMETSGAAAGD